jgi:hypothetical protein
LDHTRLSIEHWHCGHTKRDEKKVIHLREVDGGVEEYIMDEFKILFLCRLA